MGTIAIERDIRGAKAKWMPGVYLTMCDECGRMFIGDKRATMCAPCAYQDDKYDDFD